MRPEDLHDMTEGYITAALWADAERLCECEPKTDTCDCMARAESGGLEGLTVHAEDYAYAFALCEAFAREADAALIVFAEYREFAPSEGTVWSHVGHDLRLTSGGHGTGFWDRDPNPANAGPVEEEAFADAAKLLTELAGRRPFDRAGGGDVWQDSETTCTLDRLALRDGAGPGERWECPALTSAQRQCWIESGIVPTIAETMPV